MALLVPTNTPRRHVMGELVLRHYTVLTSGTTGDTLVIPQADIVHISITPQTAIAVQVGATYVGSGTGSSTITLNTSTVAATTMDVAVWSRVG